MNANTENSGKSNVDKNSSAHSQNTSTKSSSTKKSLTPTNNNNSLNVILPQYTVIDQQNLFDQNGKRTVQSSPSKSQRKFSQDSGFSANKYRNVSDCYVGNWITVAFRFENVKQVLRYCFPLLNFPLNNKSRLQVNENCLFVDDQILQHEYRYPLNY